MLRTVYPSCDLVQSWPDFEDLITVLDEWEQYRAAYEGTPAPFGPFQPAHLKKVLLKHLGLCLCAKLEACSGDSLDMIKRFVQHAVRAHCPVISFNWDLLIEVAAIDAGVSISYGGNIGDGLQAAKPHGSLNLSEMSREQWEKAQRCFNVRDVSVDFEVGDVVVVRAEDPRDAANRIIHPFAETLSVEPTARKSYQSPWLGLQWRRAMDMVQTAEEIVVIGYSLPETDFRPRILFQLAGLERERPPKLILVDPQAEQLSGDYRQFVSMPTEIVGRSWTEWFASIGDTAGDHGQCN